VDKAKPKNKRTRPAKGEVRKAPEPSALERQRTQTLAPMIAELDIDCATGTKKNAPCLSDCHPRPLSVVGRNFFA
jgi:hypothetical protein